MLGAVATLLALSLGAQIYWSQVDVNRAYYGTDARLYQLLAGALLAVTLHTWAVRLRGRRAHLVALVGFVALLVLGSGLVQIAASMRGMGATVVSVLLIGGLMLGPGQPISRLLSLRIPVFLGQISYGTYLWHWPVIIALTTLFDTSPLVIAAFALAISTGLASLSYEVLEMPIRKARVLNAFPWPTAVAGVGISALVAVTLVPTVLELDRKPAFSESVTGQDGAALSSGAARKPIPQDIDWEAVRSDVGEKHWCAGDEPEACTVRKGSGPHVLFIGDSQAVTFVPMFKELAKDHDLTLSVNVLGGCPWQEGLLNQRQSREGAAECESARVGWYDTALRELDPDIVVLLDRPRDDPSVWGDRAARRDGKKQSLNQGVFETTRDTLRKISAVADKTVVIERLVMPETFDPTDCLSSRTKIGQCAVSVPSRSSTSDGYIAAAAAETSSIVGVTLNDVFCPTAPVCLPIVGDQVVWRDDHHYTATYATERREQVWKALNEAGAFDKAK